MKIHGKATIRIDGQVYESEDDAELIVGGFKNTSRMVGTKLVHTQTIIPSKVVCKVPTPQGTDLTALQALSDVEITFESDTGDSYLIPTANQGNDISLKGGESGGTVELAFDGEPAKKIS